MVSFVGSDGLRGLVTCGLLEYDERVGLLGLSDFVPTL